MAEDEPYWRIMVDMDCKLIPVCLQQFDEKDYDQSRFVDEKHYATEEAASARIHVLNAHLGLIVNRSDRLLTMAEADDAARSFSRSRKGGKVRVPNGIACPQCGHELVDANQGIVLTSLPPRYIIECPQCRWRGNRVI